MPENLKERDDYRNLGVNVQIIVKLILEKQGGRVHTTFKWLRTELKCKPQYMW
jgi:hypothetical protein